MKKSSLIRDKLIDRGFTLIELLAVIVILGLLIGIAYPSVSSYISQTRNDTYSLHEADMKTAASNMMSQCVQNDTAGCVPKNGESKTIYLNELIDKKYTEGVRDPADTDKYCDADKSYVVVTNSSGNVVDLDYQVCLVCSDYQSGVCGSIIPGSKCNPEDDPTPPTCGEVIGSSTIWTNNDRVISIKCSDEGGCGCSQNTYYQTFTESGKTGIITINDKAGNSKACEVNTYIDKEEPTCTLEVVSGTVPSADGWYGGAAPIVKFVTKEDNLSQVATYGMGTSKKNYDFNKQDEYEVKAGISMIYGYVKDNAGNVGTCSVEVKYDNAKPTGNITFGYQVYPKDDVASTSGSVITLNSVTSEYGNIIGVKVFLSSNTSGMNTVIKNGGTELSKRTISAGVVEMLYTFTSGTYNNLTIDMGSSSNLSKVKKVELITDHTSGFYTNQDVKVYINSQDSLSGKAYYSFDGGSSWQSSNEKSYSSNQSFKVGMKDVAGNISEYTTISINNIDKLSPSCSISESGTKGDNNWYTSNISLTLNRSDATATTQYAKSDIRDYDLTTSSSVSYNKTSSKTQSSDTSGITYYGYVRDKAGNTATCSVSVKKDATAPTCTVAVSGTKGNNDWYTTNVSLSLNKSDATSGIASYGLTTSSTANYNSSTSGTQTANTTGIKWYGHVKDNAGNTGSCSVTVKKDTTAPTVTITATKKKAGTRVSSGAWSNEGLNYTLTAGTTGSSGYTIYYCKDTANTCVPTTSVTSGSSITSYNTTTGTYYIRYKIVSGAGISSSVGSYTAKVDTTTPTVTITATKKTAGTAVSNGAWSNEGLNYTLTAGTTGSSGYTIYYCKDTANTCTPSTSVTSGSSITSYNATTGIYYIRYKIVSGSGNSSSVGSYTAKVDKTAPTCGTVSGENTTWTKNDREISVACSDSSGSGCTQSSFSQKFTTTTKIGTITISDNAGNTNSCSVNVYIDKIAPATPTITNPTSGNWTNSDFSLTVSSSDSHSGIAYWYYSYNNSTWTSYGSASYGKTTYTTTAFSAERNQLAYIRVCDVAGNCSSGSTYIRIDKTAPTCSISPSGTTATLTCTDTSSGVSKYYWGTSSGGTPSTAYSKAVSKTGISSGTYYLRATDKAGNTSTAVATTINACTSLTIGQSTEKHPSSVEWYSECGVTDKFINLDFRTYFTMSDACTSVGIQESTSSYMCYYNPDGYKCDSYNSTYMFYYPNSKNYRYIGGTTLSSNYSTSGDWCFKSSSRWIAIRSTECVKASACNKDNQCATMLACYS